ncbi:MAG: hypothetical protein ABI378_05775, partial [Chitinophagaceae bacterium]
MLKNTVGRQCNGEDFNCGKCAPRNAMASRCVLVLILNLLLATSGFAQLAQLTQIQKNRQLVEHYLDTKQYDSAAIFGKRIINDKT